jgi:hypothetical protein
MPRHHPLGLFIYEVHWFLWLIASMHLLRYSQMVMDRRSNNILLVSNLWLNSSPSCNSRKPYTKAVRSGHHSLQQRTWAAQVGQECQRHHCLIGLQVHGFHLVSGSREPDPHCRVDVPLRSAHWLAVACYSSIPTNNDMGDLFCHSDNEMSSQGKEERVRVLHLAGRLVTLVQTNHRVHDCCAF